jgi:hypothetical protein
VIDLEAIKDRVLDLVASDVVRFMQLPAGASLVDPTPYTLAVKSIADEMLKDLADDQV